MKYFISQTLNDRLIDCKTMIFKAFNNCSPRNDQNTKDNPIEMLTKGSHARGVYLKKDTS